MNFRVLEQARRWDPIYRKEREKYLIRKFNSYYSGLNRPPWCPMYWWPMYLFWRRSNSSFPAGLVNWFNWFLLTLQTAKYSTKKESYCQVHWDFWNKKGVASSIWSCPPHWRTQRGRHLCGFFQLCRILLNNLGADFSPYIWTGRLTLNLNF